ncbi:methyltransferase domain-containing protein [Streptomyces sp. NPDC003077]|uniref:methyltransferase domain-containing protein n=1 Tax=Streptomyces sp. NPDC003077 TaxID=3154443 RepID=UPI0033A3C721
MTNGMADGTAGGGRNDARDGVCEVRDACGAGGRWEAEGAQRRLECTRSSGDPVAREAAVARAGLVRSIREAGRLTDPRWRAAFEEVPRHLFVPHYFLNVLGGTYERLSATDPDPRRRARWLAGAYADDALGTWLRDGALVSSSSQPSLMAMMLEALRVEDVTDRGGAGADAYGCEVLEVGTGTGYNAALLAHRLGDERVTTIDVDEDITKAARERLAATGHRPVVVTGDGALGCPSRAPFDRVVATCALPSVPPAWVEQCVPGGLILAPLATGLIALRVAERRGGTPRAEGRFLPTPVFFVPLRGEGADGRDGGVRAGTGAAGGAGRARRPDAGGGGGGGPGFGSDFGSGLRSASDGGADVGSGGGSGVGSGGGSGRFRGGAPVYGLPRAALRDGGFRFLLALAAGARSPTQVYELWRRENRPARNRFGLTVEGDRQWVWLDDPGGPERWALG